MLLIFVLIFKKAYIITAVQIYECKQISEVIIIIFAALIFFSEGIRYSDSQRPLSLRISFIPLIERDAWGICN